MGNSTLPSTFDIRNKAKIALSSSLAKKVSDEYDKVQSEYKNKNIDENEYINKIANLREFENNPDNINESNSEEIKNLIIDPDSMERHYEEKAFYKQASEDKSNIISKQAHDLNKKDNEISKLRTQEGTRKLRNKRILKGLACLPIIFLLFYFSDYLMPSIDRFIYIIGGLASILTVCISFYMYRSKIKSWWKKQ